MRAETADGRRRWIMSQRWEDLLFAHWPLPAGIVRALVPARLELETRDGSAWIGVSPFRITGLRARGLPAIPGTSAFPELNLRTYVRAGGRSGVYFFSLDAGNPLAVIGARTAFRLPYFWSRMAVSRTDGGIAYSSRRRFGVPARFEASYAPDGPPSHSAPGSLAHWLTERYCLFTADASGVRRVDIEHDPWLLQPARASIRCRELASAAQLPIEGPPALAHFSAALDVRVRAPQPL